MKKWMGFLLLCGVPAAAETGALTLPATAGVAEVSLPERVVLLTRCGRTPQGTQLLGAIDGEYLYVQEEATLHRYIAEVGSEPRAGKWVWESSHALQVNKGDLPTTQTARTEKSHLITRLECRGNFVIVRCGDAVTVCDFRPVLRGLRRSSGVSSVQKAAWERAARQQRHAESLMPYIRLQNGGRK